MIRHKILLPFWNTKKLYIIIITVIYNNNDDNMEFLCENDLLFNKFSCFVECSLPGH